MIRSLLLLLGLLLAATAASAQTALYPPNTALMGPVSGSPTFPQPRAISPTDLTGILNVVASSNNNIITNAGFVIDQQHVGAATTVVSAASAVRAVDRWFTLFNASTSGAGNPTVQQLATSAGLNLSPFELKIAATTAGATVPAALQFITFQSIEGGDIADLRLGTTDAQPFFVSLWLKSSLASGVIGVFVQNGASTRSFVHNCLVVSAATWTFCSFAVAADTAGAWNRVINTVGMIVGITTACGATFQTGSPDTWTAAGTGNFTCTGSQTQYTNSAAATVETTAVVVNRGTFAAAYYPLPAPAIINLVERHYRKSFALGTAPAQNVGAGTGEACFENPIAAGEGSLTVYYQRMFGAAQTVTLFNPAAANANFRNETAAADVAAGAAIASATNTFIPTAATVATIAHRICIHYTVDAGM